MVEVPSFAAGGGKIGALLREHDWSKTPLGPLEIWPQSLRTTVGLVLHSVVPIVLLWGQDGTMIYNDAYSIFAGGRHPALFGSKVREGWPEIADFNDNVMKIGLAGGTLAYSDQELTLYRSGQPEQVWMNLDYSPAPDERGNPAGVIAIVVETTARVLAERRQAAERERQRAIFQQMPGFVGVLTGPDHVFEYVNDAYVAISGPRTFVGRSVREVFPELEGQGFYELLDQVYATGKPFRAQAMPIRLVAENEDRYIDLLYEPIRNDGGEVTGIFVGGYDVTDRVRAEARRETLARLTDKLHDLTNPDDIAWRRSMPRSDGRLDPHFILIGGLLIRSDKPRPALASRTERRLNRRPYLRRTLAGKAVGTGRAGKGDEVESERPSQTGYCLARSAQT